ncbi:MAG: DUF2484 family protein [Rhodobacteraceae bacterium]|nr:DUF2484 family protein [Paracoccaceae bacterium]
MTALFTAAIWAIMANMTALLPHGRLHWNMGRLLVLSSPVILWLVGRDFGWLAMVVFVVVIISLFRIPLGHMVRQLREKMRGHG